MNNQADLLPPREPEPLAHMVTYGLTMDWCRYCGAWRAKGSASNGTHWHSEWRLGDTSPVWCPGKKETA